MNVRMSSSSSSSHRLHSKYLGLTIQLYKVFAVARYRAQHTGAWRSERCYKRIWPENWVDGGGLGITIRNEPRETVLTSIPISGRGVGNAAG